MGMKGLRIMFAMFIRVNIHISVLLSYDMSTCRTQVFKKLHNLQDAAINMATFAFEVCTLHCYISGLIILSVQFLVFVISVNSVAIYGRTNSCMFNDCIKLSK